MMNSTVVVEALSSSDLRSATWDLVRRSHGLDAALLVHLGEIEDRKLYLDWSFPSMFAYCVEELGFSEDVACNRINIARAAASRVWVFDEGRLVEDGPPAQVCDSPRSERARAFFAHG